jgi:uncharacterized protein involved in exopolysaccharide biosynthesis
VEKQAIPSSEAAALTRHAERAELDRDVAGPDLRLPLVRDVSRNLSWVLLATLLGAAVGIGIGVTSPNLYDSNAKLLLRIGAREQLTSESLVDIEERQRAQALTMVDELQVLLDAETFERVARAVGPRSIMQPADPGRDDGPRTSAPVRLLHAVQGAIFRGVAKLGLETDEDELVLATKHLKKHATIVDEPGSSVILVSYRSTSPERARDVVQALTSAFVERHREHFSIDSLVEESRSRLEEAGTAVDEAARAYVEHVSQSGLGELEVQVPRLEAELRLLENALFESRNQREAIAGRRALLSKRPEGTPVEVELPTSSVLIPNDEYETQLTLKRMLLAQKQEMLVQTRPSEELRRRVAEFDRQVARVTQLLAETPRTIVQGTAMLANLGDSERAARITALEADDGALQAKLGLQESRLEAKRLEMSEMQRQLLTATMKRDDLASAREVAEAHGAHLLDRLSVLKGLAKIDNNGEANLRVMQPPTLEQEKVGPARGSLALKGTLAGMFLGIVFAVLRPRFERRLNFPEAFEQEREVPVLGVVPHLSSLRRLAARAQVEGA